MPSISTGVFGYPLKDAAQIAVRETKAFLTAAVIVWLLLVNFFRICQIKGALSFVNGLKR